MRDQPVPVEGNPFASVVTRFVGKPIEFGPTVIRLLCGLPTKRALPLIHGDVDLLMLYQGKRFQRAQYALLVNGFKVYRHGTFIVPGAVVATGGVSHSSLPLFLGSDSRFLNPFDDELPNDWPRRFLEPVCTCRFLQSGDPLTRKVSEQSGQCRASNDQVMRSEHRPYFVVATLGVKKLAPGKHIGPFQENNLQPGLALGPNCLPVALSIDRNRVHDVAPFWARFGS
jgi:hypothetical protein